MTADNEIDDDPTEPDFVDVLQEYVGTDEPERSQKIAKITDEFEVTSERVQDWLRGDELPDEKMRKRIIDSIL